MKPAVPGVLNTRTLCLCIYTHGSVSVKVSGTACRGRYFWAMVLLTNHGNACLQENGNKKRNLKGAKGKVFGKT